MSKILFSFILLFVSLLFNYFGAVYIAHLSIVRPIIPDLILDSTPHIIQMGYVADLIAVVAVMFLLYLMFKRKEKILFYNSVLSLVYFIRAFLIVINPIGDSYGKITYLGLFPASNYSQGMFPSAHTALVMAIFLFYLSEKFSWKKLMGLLVILEILSLIFAKGHYTMDIVGGVLLAYSSFKFMEK